MDSTLLPEPSTRGASTAPRALVVVANPGSAGADPARLAAALAVLQRLGVPHAVLRAERGGEVPALAGRAARLARAERGALIAAGGDGTINAVAAAALEHRCPMGVLPQGTFNVFARTHGLPDEPEAAARAWCHGHVKPVQVGLVNGRPFVVNASLGVYPRILQAREADSRTYGRNRLVALWSALRTALGSREVLQLTLARDGGPARRVRARLLFIGNNRLQIESLGLPHAAVVGEQRLAAIRVAPVGWPAMLRLLLLGASGTLGTLAPSDEVQTELFDRLTIVPTRGLARPFARTRLQVACDGEVLRMDAPLTIAIGPERLELLCPPPTS